MLWLKNVLPVSREADGRLCWCGFLRLLPTQIWPKTILSSSYKTLQKNTTNILSTDGLWVGETEGWGHGRNETMNLESSLVTNNNNKKALTKAQKCTSQYIHIQVPVMSQTADSREDRNCFYEMNEEFRGKSYKNERGQESLTEIH